MSSTVRVYVNNKRIATGKVWKNQFLQVYPEKKIFVSEAAWRTSIYESLNPTIQFVTTEDVKKVKAVKEVKPEPKPVVKPEPKPVVKPIINPEDDEEDYKPKDNNWFCGYCSLPQGNDHRMCICRGYNFSVAAWEDGRIFLNKNKKNEEKESNNTSISKNRSDWEYKSSHKMTLPPGTYYIGDLCYALDDTLYDKVFGPKYNDGYYVSKSNPSDVFMMGSTGGDGEFRGTDGHSYPVDAGIIGIASESTLDKKKQPYCGTMYTFQGNVHVKFREDKFQFFGDRMTDPELTIYVYEDEDEYYEDSE